MKIKGFTLIELLAVIVILAIIALIAVPIILNIIGDARNESKKRSIDLYGKSIELAIARKSITEEVPIGIYKTSGNTLKLEDSDFSFEVEYDGSKVECDVVKLYDEGTIYLNDCKVDGEKVNYSYGENYTKIEYLESTGTQFINTKVIPTDDTRVDLGIESLIIDKADKVIFGSDWSWTGFFLVIKETQFQWLAPDMGNNFFGEFTINTKYDISCFKGKVTINNELLLDKPYPDTPHTWAYPISIFRTTNTNRDLGIFRLYYFKIYDKDVLVRDFIPVLDEEGTPCLYDKVEKTFYYNQGTGEFEYK